MQYNSPEQFGEMLETPLPGAREVIEVPKTPEKIFAENKTAVVKKAAESGIILDEEMRIEMNEKVFLNNNVLKDLSRINFLEQQKIRSLSLVERKAETARQEYEGKLSSLIVINFNKFLGDDFLVARTAQYDKAANGADIVITFELNTSACLPCRLGK
jgi:hypothetical protein